MSSVNSLQSGKAWQAYTQQTEKSHSHKKSAVSRHVYAHALLLQHLYSAFFQHIFWYGPTSEIACMQRRQNNWLKYADFTELKKITSRIYWNCSNYSFLFFKSLKFRCCPFASLKKKLQLTVQVCYLFYFLFQGAFFKGKEKSGIFGGF